MNKLSSQEQPWEKNDLNFAFSRGPFWQRLQPFRPSTPRCPLAVPRQRPHLLKQKRAGKVRRI